MKTDTSGPIIRPGKSERSPADQAEIERLGKDYEELQKFRQKQLAQGVRRAVLMEAFQTWGQRNREDKLLEEAGEAAQAIIKARYNPCRETQLHKIEEIVDLGILVDQLKVIFEATGLGEELANLERQKLQKLQRKIQEGSRS